VRIVAGEWRGRVIRAPDDRRVRPTADRVREAWMSIVESAPRTLAVLAKNIASLDADGRCTVHRVDALRFIEKAATEAYDMAFADPPYGLGLAARVAEQWRATPFAPVLGVEHAARDAMPPGGDTRRYGDTAITFYRLDSEP